MAQKKKIVAEKKIGNIRGTIWSTDVQKRWLIKWSYPQPGKRYLTREQKVVVGLKIEAEKFLDNVLREIDQGHYRSRQCKTTLAQFLQTWLESKVSGVDGKVLKPKTILSYQNILTHILAHNIAHMVVQDITPSDIRQFANDLMQTELSPRTKQYTLRLLKSALDNAAELELINKNPAHTLKIGKNASPKRTPLSHDELQRIFKELSDEHYGIVLEFIAVSGVRVGECLGLTWDSVDWEHNTVTICQQVINIGNRVVVEDTLKTQSSQRTIALPTTFMAKLRQHKRHQMLTRLNNPGEAWSTNLVFATRHGTPIDPNHLRRTFRRVLKHCSLSDGYHIHDLRHTYATLLYAKTRDIKLVSSVLGHANIQITLDIYTHTTETAKKEIAQIADDIFYH
ncbi:tyrosine-type recombinase/integrase [Sulfobacillus thermosulfidooxidans]|uniref:tyrosine-type recombinase/integrase n=1 Tax=Sulfobacillus thermosulfidooxidans TaxID=28034 RepID=UPI0006B5C7EB|nr:tyrosine-type recombinase/integrase [Sulfobacillus thermosulfidooxidans]